MYEELCKVAPHNERHILALFSLFGIPDSYIDVGSGIDTMVKTAAKLGVRSKGIDILDSVVQSNDPPYFHINHDLNKVYRTKETFDLVTCLEVAEHLEDGKALCKTLALLVKLGGILVFTAATPGQGGIDHISLRPPSDWREWLTINGLTYNRQLTMMLCLIWTNIHSPLGFLSANLQVFTKGSVITKSGIVV